LVEADLLVEADPADAPLEAAPALLTKTPAQAATGVSTVEADVELDADTPTESEADAPTDAEEDES